LNTAYENGPRAKLSDEYKRVTTSGNETPESKLVLENLNQVIDRQIDALARATALASNPADKKAAMDALAALYKYRNQGATDANVTELVAKVLSQPVPEPPTPITSLPTTPTPAATPTTPGTTGAGNGNTTGGAKSAGNNLTNTSTTGGNKTGNGAATGTQSGGSKPAASPTPLTKKPRLNHRRG